MKDFTILECFDEALERTPHAIAVLSNSSDLTFSRLNLFSNQLAQQILHSAGENDRSVVLLMGRTPLVIPGMLAILKTGMICIPIHPVNNEARILDSVLKEHQTPIIVTDNEGVSFLKRLQKTALVVNMEDFDKSQANEAPNIQISTDDSAFIVYTSGSTGIPKGVVHSHRAIVARIDWYHHRFNINEKDTTLMLSSADSISGIVGMFRPLLTGGRLIVFSIRRRGFPAMARIIDDEGVTLLPMVNSVFRHFVETLPENEIIESVRLIILGGEAMTSGDVERYRKHFSKDCLLLNTLGCTELPTYRFFVADKNYQPETSIVPVGHAVVGNEALIIDENGDTVEPGVVGEIVVKSKQLSLGYLNRKEETKSRFFKADDGTPCYKTGDLGKMRGDGILVFLGRKDTQVKILGNRVELAEIENALINHPDVSMAAIGVIKDDPENLKLYANLVFSKPDTVHSNTQLADYLMQSLPDYMIPLDFISVPALPLTRTGKIDYNALVTPDLNEASQNLIIEEELHTPTEEAVSAICKEALCVDHLLKEANLIHLGANSLFMMKVANRINKKFSVRVPMTVLFNQANVTGIARYLEEHYEE